MVSCNVGPSSCCFVPNLRQDFHFCKVNAGLVLQKLGCCSPPPPHRVAAPLNLCMEYLSKQKEYLISRCLPDESNIAGWVSLVEASVNYLGVKCGVGQRAGEHPHKVACFCEHCCTLHSREALQIGHDDTTAPHVRLRLLEYQSRISSILFVLSACFSYFFSIPSIFDPFLFSFYRVLLVF